MRMDKKVIQRPRARCARGPRAVRGPRARCADRASIRPLRASIRCLRSLPPLVHVMSQAKRVRSEVSLALPRLRRPCCVQLV